MAGQVRLPDLLRSPTVRHYGGLVVEINYGVTSRAAVIYKNDNILLFESFQGLYILKNS
jgi:hypothetical protein